VDAVEEKVTALRAQLNAILDGTRKREVCDWWLHFIETKADDFLKGIGYLSSALPPNYTDVPPSDMDVVVKNLKLLQSALDGEWGVKTFVEKTLREVYVVLDQFLSEMAFVLGEEWRTCLGEEEEEWRNVNIAAVKMDYEYMMKMKEMDEELIRIGRQEGEKDGEKRGEEGDATGVKEGEKKRLKLTDVVPIAGLIMGRFHMYECEHLTVIDIWTPKSKGFFSRLSRFSLSFSLFSFSLFSFSLFSFYLFSFYLFSFYLFSFYLFSFYLFSFYLFSFYLFSFYLFSSLLLFS
jgi:hypothetical protein